MHIKAFGLSVVALVAMASTAVFAQSSEEILARLTPKVETKSESGGATRSLGIKPRDAAPEISARDQDFIDELATSRSIGIKARVELQAVVETYEMPSLDLDIPFDYDSYSINSKARRQLNELGTALVQLGDGKFILSGHTDARGSGDYNQQLSELRAVSVRDYLSDYYNIDPTRLIAVGYGEEQLKDEYDPGSPVNRRVTIVNVTAQK